MDTIHAQVPVLWFTCDEEIADLITLMNYCGIRTINSCQDNRLNRGHVPPRKGGDPRRELALVPLNARQAR